MVQFSYFKLSERELEEHVLFERQLPKGVRERVFERDRRSCRSCNSDDMLSVHHIVYRSKHYDHSMANLVSLCWRCHQRIHDGTLLMAVIDGNFFFGGRNRWK